MDKQAHRPIVVCVIGTVAQLVTVVRLEGAVIVVSAHPKAIVVYESGGEDLAVGLHGHAGDVSGVGVVDLAGISEAPDERAVGVVAGQVAVAADEQRSVGVDRQRTGMRDAEVALDDSVGAEGGVESQVVVELQDPEVVVDGSDGEDLAVLQQGHLVDVVE